jgi:hypothetical protein
MVDMTTIPAFKAALKVRLEAIAWTDPDPLILWGDVSPGEPDWRMITIAKAISNQDTVVVGGFVSEETYQVALEILVTGQSQTLQEEIETSAYDLAATIETSLLAWASETPAFNGIVKRCRVTGVEDDLLQSKQGRGSLVTLTITCYAWLNED